MLKMYIKETNGVPIAYRFGENYEAIALLIDGGYKTQEEAVLAWARENGYIKERSNDR